jgi:hypothetical protein
MNKIKRSFKRFLVIFFSALFLFSAQPANAGSGSDGILEVSWKDWKKSKAKNCARQKINVTLLQPISYATAELKLYNGDDEEVASSFVIINGTTKRSGFFQFCSSPGAGPYYINVQGRLGIPGTNTEFDIPYKFKKK